MRNAYSVFLWITLPTTFVSAISDLQLVLLWLDQLKNALPLALPLFNAIGAVLAPLIDTWRAFTRPLLSFLELFVPFELSPEALDLLILVSLPASRMLVWIWHLVRVGPEMRAARSDRDLVRPDQMTSEEEQALPCSEEYEAIEEARTRVDLAIQARFRRIRKQRVWLGAAMVLALLGFALMVLDRYYRDGAFGPVQ